MEISGLYTMFYDCTGWKTEETPVKKMLIHNISTSPNNINIGHWIPASISHNSHFGCIFCFKYTLFMRMRL